MANDENNRPTSASEQEAFNNNATPNDAKHNPDQTPADVNEGQSGTPTVIESGDNSDGDV